MKIGQVRERYIIKAEKNATNDGIASDNLRFALLFNESQNKFFGVRLKDRKIDNIRDVQNFLVLDQNISPLKKSNDKVDFKLPENYFDLSSVRATAKKENCYATIKLDELRTENLSEVVEDELSKPSFEWRQALYTINSNNLSVYTEKKFDITEILLNYYRYPNQIKLLDENSAESDFNENFPIEWDDKSLDDIITIMCLNNDINENNPRFQAQIARLQK